MRAAMLPAVLSIALLPAMSPPRHAAPAQVGAAGGVVATARSGAAPTAPPTVEQSFSTWGSGRFSSDGLWQKNGDWTTGWSKNTILMTNAVVRSGLLALRTPARLKQSGEIQSAPKAPVTFSYGYYETRMQVPSVAGVCSSFFFIATDYGLPEIDVEFLTNEPWLASASTGRVHLSVHKANGTVRDYRVVDLPFNPSKAMHRYGFVIGRTSVAFTVDGGVVWTDPLPSTWSGGVPRGFVMANIWTGSPDWGGGPPAKDAVSTYDWMRYYAGASSPAP